VPLKLPSVLTQEEVQRIIKSAEHLMHSTILMTLYSTGMRGAELCRLKVSDIDSKRGHCVKFCNHGSAFTASLPFPEHDHAGQR
jgi:integrase